METATSKSEEKREEKKESFFFNDTATTEIYTLSLHDALPISKLEDDYMNSTLPEAMKQEWLDYTKRGVVDVHGLQLGPFSVP